MQKRGVLQKGFVLTLVLLLSATVLLSYFNQETTGNVVRRGTISSAPVTPALPAPILSPPPTPTLPAPTSLPQAPPCVTPNTIPATITTSLTLCGTIPMTAPTVITASNVLVVCDPGTVLTKAQGTQAFDALQIAPGLTNVQIHGCTFTGGFSNALHIGAGVTSSQIANNNILGAEVGIKEAFTAQLNTYSGNTIKQTITGMHLEGSQGTVIGSTLTDNKHGIQTGTDPTTLTQTTPNAICSRGITINQFPAQPLPVYCSIPQSGKGYTLTNNRLLKNGQGIITYSTDNLIQLNTIQSNDEGIQVNAMYVGFEVNPFIPTYPQLPLNNLQEYFNAGHQITGNTITQNRWSGIQLHGRSTYFWRSSRQYHRKTIIGGNTISSNGQLNTPLTDGIVVGRKDSITNQNNLVIQFQEWNEYTDINNNIIQNNLNDGLVLLNGYMTDIRSNTIHNNRRNGISIGSPRESTQIQGYYPDWGYPRFTYRNSIKNNVRDGIHVYYGTLYYVLLNEIDNNNRGIYVPADPSGYYTQTVYKVICNDLSYNTLEGFNYDGSLMRANWGGYSSVDTFSHNRIINNGADGIRYYISSNAILPSRLNNFFLIGRTYNNHIEGNGFAPNTAYSNSGHGITADGFYYHGFFANNFRNNNLGHAYDTGSLRMENMWDEYQYELGYDNQVCKNCGGSCVGDWECGYYSGTCVNNVCQPPPGSGLTCNPSTGNANCYANPNRLPYAYRFYYNYPFRYVPRGNFGLATRSAPFIVPPSSTPPLRPGSCTNHQQCTTNSCENYPAPVNNQQCGNADFINEPLPFGGYYQPPFDCPRGEFYWPPYFGIISETSPGRTSTSESDSLEEQRLSSSVPEEYKKSLSFLEALKDRIDLENRRKDFEASMSPKNGATTPIEE